MIVIPLSIVKNGIILEIKVWIKLKGFIPNLGNTIKIIPKYEYKKYPNTIEKIKARM